MTKWLRDSGLKVNEEKTEMCLFHRYDHHPITIVLNGKQIMSSNRMNVLGVTFDSKLQWGDHISSTVKKANTALHAIRLIKQYFTPTELRSPPPKKKRLNFQFVTFQLNFFNINSLQSSC